MDNEYDAEAEHADAFMDTGFWGRKGAGCVVFALSTGRMLLAHRSEWVLEPHTWGMWGGAIDPTENPQMAALRELTEETGFDAGDSARVIESLVFESPGGDFRYHNFIVVVEHEYEPTLNWESQGSAWVDPNDLPANLHPGLEALVTSDTAQVQLAELAKEASSFQASVTHTSQPTTAVERFRQALLAAERALETEQKRPLRTPRMG